MDLDEPSTPDRDDLWAWMDEVEDPSGGPAIDPAAVVAVMVVHNAREWLPRQLLSLARLHPRPGRLIAVDNGSSDDGPALLERAAAEGVVDQVVAGSAELGFGEAVALGLAELEPEWVWLLHDDSAPRPDALGALLEGAVDTGAAIVVPKLLQPKRRNYPETLAEVGQSISRSGRRVPLVEEGDIDQQQESPEPVLGASTAGMLVRGDVFRDLDGLSPELPLHRDGVDLGWRAAAAGHLVTTWPDAALTHRQAGRTGERAPTLGRTSHEVDRLAALRVVAARGEQPPGRAALVAGSWARAVGFLLAKSPSLAGAEVRAASRFLATPEATASLAARPAGDADLSDILPPRFWGIRHAFDRFGNAVAERYRDLTSSEADTSLDELTGDDFAGGGSRRRRFLSPVLLLVVGLLVAAFAAGRTLLGSAGVAGGGLLAAPANVAAAWDAYLSPAVAGPGANAPWLGFAAFFSTFALNSPQWLAFASLLLSPLLAGLAAHALLRRLGLDVAPSAAAAGVWAGAVLLLGLVTAGDISGMVLAVAGPLLARSMVGVVTNTTSGAERLRAPAGAAFWLLVCAAAWPAMLLLALLAGIVWCVRDRSRWVDVGITVGLPLLFLAPWLPTLGRWPGRLLTGADPLAWPAYPPASIATLVGRILPSGLPLWANVTFFAVLGLAALYSLIRIPREADRLRMVGAIALPLIAGAALSRVALEVNGGQARPLLSGWALLAVAALLVPILVRQYRSDPEEPVARDSRSLLVALGAVAALAAVVWAWVGFAGPVHQAPSQLPGYVRDAVASARDARVLMVRLTDADSLAWNVVDRQQPRWGSGERSPAGPFAADFAGLVQSLSAGAAPEDLASRLTSLGVSHVWMQGFDPERLAAIGNAPGLTRANATDDAVVWTVVGRVSRAQVVEAAVVAPVVDGQVAAADHPRFLVLAEEDDPRWQASIGGVALEPAPDRPPVTFTVPAGVAGELTYGLRPTTGALVWQVIILLALIALALPTLGGSAQARRGLE